MLRTFAIHKALRKELTLPMAAAAVEVEKNGPVYRLFNSLVYPKQEDSSNIKASSIPVQSSSLRNQSGQTSRLPNPSDKVVADPDTASDIAYGTNQYPVCQKSGLKFLTAAPLLNSPKPSPKNSLPVPVSRMPSKNPHAVAPV